MSDNDSTFINKSFQEILEKNKIIHQPNIIDDHHALGLIDRFARTLKMILTRLFLQTKSTNWIDYIEQIIKNYNNNGHSAIDYISPNEAFLEKNFEKIYNINYEKSLFNIAISDIDVNDKVRIKIKGQFRKGTEARYTDEVYTVKKVKGNAVTLDNDEVYKRSSLLIVPKTTVTDEKNVIVKVNKQNKINRNIDKEGLDVSNIVLDKRRRDILLNTLENSRRVEDSKKPKGFSRAPASDVINTDRVKREEKSTNKYKSINKLIRNEDMTRTEARKAMKQVEDVLGPARNTRSQSRKLRNTRT